MPIKSRSWFHVTLWLGIVHGAAAFAAGKAEGDEGGASEARSRRAAERGIEADELPASTPAPTSKPIGSHLVPVSPERRIALVIGNGAYANGRLRNPPSDARLMAGSLRAVGFEVAELVDVDQAAMKRAINELETRAANADVALFYFAGHGVQANGRNYLIPLGARISRMNEVDLESVDLARPLAALENSHASMKIIILDACRNNPFERMDRAMDRGLAFVNAARGTLIAYATAPGSVAEDGTGENSIYTSELARQIASPGIKVEDVFKRVRTAVRTRSNDRQIPWESVSIESDFFFVSDDARRAPALDLAANGEADAKQAQYLYERGLYEDAAKLFARLKVDHPDMPAYERHLGACLYRLKRPEPALSNLQRYLARQPGIAAGDKQEVVRWIDEMETLRAASQPLATRGNTSLVDSPPVASAPRSFYRTWWFWTGAAAVVAGVVTVAVLASRHAGNACDGRSPTCFEVE